VPYFYIALIIKLLVVIFVVKNAMIKILWGLGVNTVSQIASNHPDIDIGVILKEALEKILLIGVFSPAG